MIIVGLTGSIGMGKTTAGNMLAELGIAIHDADKAVHQLMGPGGAAVDAVADAFPESLAKDESGSAYIDRKALGQSVFGAPEKLKKLEGILHPLVREDSANFIMDHKAAGDKIVVLDIPLLFEAGRDKDVDVTICVSAPKDIQEARVLARPGMTKERFEKVLKSQMPDAEKCKRADFVIDSGTGLEDMRAQLAAVVTKLEKMASGQRPKNGASKASTHKKKDL